MEDTLGLLRIHLKRGISLAVRDAFDHSSDPYCIISMGLQKLKTKVVKDNCNPEWNKALTLSVKNPINPINLVVYDKDTFTPDDEMGEAEIDIKPYIEAVKMCRDIDVLSSPSPLVLKVVEPNAENCLAEESSIVWDNGNVTQEMHLRLKKVECGIVVVGLEWMDVPGCKGLYGEGLVF